VNDRRPSPIDLVIDTSAIMALAKHLEVPLLCVGDDFAQTDVELARS